jgi:hypothetical protein
MRLTTGLLTPTGLLTLLFACGLSAPAAALPQLAKHDIQALEEGHVIEFSEKVEGRDVQRARAIGLFKDFPEAVTYVLMQVDKYKHFMPRIKEARIIKRKGWHTYALVETAMPWPVKDAWMYIKYTRSDRPGRVFEIKFWMLNGTMKSYQGRAVIEPWPRDPSRTVMTYEFLAEPRTLAPASVITTGIRSVANVFVQRIRLRLQAMRKYKKLPARLRPR